jgi:DNA topoisomerase-1
MLEFARCLPDLRARVAADLREEGLPKQRVLALGVKLLDVGMFRIGGEEYAAEHETYGIATIEKRHLRLCNGAARFDYPAKGGKRRQISIADPIVVDLLTQLKARRGGGSGLLAWRDGRRWVDVTSRDLNVYLKEHSGGDFTAKDFRTWDATLLAAVLCAQAPRGASRTIRRRTAVGIVGEVAESLGNTPAVCRKSYIDPRVLDRFDCGETIAPAIEQIDPPIELREAQTLSEIERAVLSLLADNEDLEIVAA